MYNMLILYVFMQCVFVILSTYLIIIITSCEQSSEPRKCLDFILT